FTGQHSIPTRRSSDLHRYLADNLSVAKYLEKRRQADIVEVLLIVDPTMTLDGAKKEEARILKVFQKFSKLHVTKIEGEDGSRQRSEEHTSELQSLAYL